MFEKLPGLGITVPVQQFTPAPARPVFPSADIAETIVRGVSAIIQAGSPEEKAKKRLELLKLRKELSGIPFEDQLRKNVFEHANDPANFDTTEVYGPGGVHLEVKPVSPEWKAAAPGVETTLPQKNSAVPGSRLNQADVDEAASAMLLPGADGLPPSTTPTAPLAQVPDLAPNQSATAPDIKPVLPPGYTDLGLNPADNRRYAQAPDGTRVALVIPISESVNTSTAGPSAISATETTEGPKSIAPNFDEPPAVPPGYRLQRFGNDWRAINRSGHSFVIPNKWQKTNEVDQATGITHEVWVNSSDPRQRYYPPGQAKPTPVSPGAQIVNQIQRQENTSTQLRAFTSAINRYDQMLDNATKPFADRTATDDEALIKAHAGIETPGQAITNEQLKLVYDSMGIKDRWEVFKSNFGKKRVLSDDMVKNILARDHQTVDEVRKNTVEALSPFLARADANKIPFDQVIGVDPRNPLPIAEAGSGKKPGIQVPKMPSENRAAKEFQKGLIYTDAQGRRAKYLGDGQWQPVP